MTSQVVWPVVVGFSYVSIIAGSIGMMVFATKFPLSGRIQDLRLLADTTFLGMTGDIVWFLSWLLIIAGTLIQLLDYVY